MNEYAWMIDIETLSTKKNAIITQIGLVKFNTKNGLIAMTKLWEISPFRLDLERVCLYKLERDYRTAMTQAPEGFNKVYGDHDALKDCVAQVSNLYTMSIATGFKLA